MSNLSENLKSIRKSKKILQKDVAEFLQIPLRTYQSYEYGEVDPNTTTLSKLADYLEVSTDVLLGRSDDPKRY